MRLPGESEIDWKRRAFKAENTTLDVDRIVGPATNGPRFAGETESAWKERLANHDRYYALLWPNRDDDSDSED